MRIPRFAPSRTVLIVALLVAAALTTAAWLGLQPPSPAEPAFPLAEATPAPATAPAGPPWRYGRADARFTVVAPLRHAMPRVPRGEGEAPPPPPTAQPHVHTLTRARTMLWRPGA